MKASDGGGLSASAEVLVEVEDANDNAPVFSSQLYTFSSTPATAVGDRLGQIVVTDPDLPPHNRTQLFILDGNTNGEKSFVVFCLSVFIRN